MNSTKGFTLIELVVVIILLGIVGMYVVPHSFSSADATLPSQTQKFATDLRHVQTLAATCGETWSISYTSGSGSYSYTLAPKNGSSTICSGKGLTYAQNQLKVSLSGPSPLDFDSLGRPSAGSTYTLTSDTGATNHVYVAATTGRVSTDVPGFP